ncbi:MAG: cytochrome c1 [Beijerinckiaceae bacterium]
MIFPGNRIAMAPPLTDGVVEYPKEPDGKPIVPETVAQYSKDVAAFLMWAAEPKLDQRKRIGFEVMLYLLLAAGLMYFVKKRYGPKFTPFSNNDEVASPRPLATSTSRSGQHCQSSQEQVSSGRSRKASQLRFNTRLHPVKITDSDA